MLCVSRSVCTNYLTFIRNGRREAGLGQPCSGALCKKAHHQFDQERFHVMATATVSPAVLSRMRQGPLPSCRYCQSDEVPTFLHIASSCGGSALLRDLFNEFIPPSSAKCSSNANCLSSPLEISPVPRPMVLYCQFYVRLFFQTRINFGDLIFGISS